jgi:hypothetical protein
MLVEERQVALLGVATPPRLPVDRLLCGGGGLFGSMYIDCALTRVCGVDVCFVGGSVQASAFGQRCRAPLHHER